MVILADGFHDFAVRELLPANRIYPWRNTMRRIYHHSLEGRRGSYTAYNDPNRFPTGWTGTVAYDGTAYQHAPVWAGLAHGGPWANSNGPGWEAEGGLDDGDGDGIDEPLTPAQVATYQRIHADMAAFTGYTYIRDGTNQDFRLVEHREAAQTACPSGRYAPLWAALNQEESLTPEDVAAISAGQFLELLAQAIGAKESTFSDTVMVDLIRSRLTGVSSTNRKIDDHIANHAAGLYSAAIKPGTEGKVIFQ